MLLCTHMIISHGLTVLQQHNSTETASRASMHMFCPVTVWQAGLLVELLHRHCCLPRCRKRSQHRLHLQVEQIVFVGVREAEWMAGTSAWCQRTCCPAITEGSKSPCYDQPQILRHRRGRHDDGSGSRVVQVTPRVKCWRLNPSVTSYVCTWQDGRTNIRLPSLFVLYKVVNNARNLLARC
jgi:hypothetical protein